MKADRPLLLRGVGDAFGGFVFNGGYENFTACDEGDFVSFRRNDHLSDAVGKFDKFGVGLVVGLDGNLNFTWSFFRFFLHED